MITVSRQEHSRWNPAMRHTVYKELVVAVPESIHADPPGTPDLRFLVTLGPKKREYGVQRLLRSLLRLNLDIKCSNVECMLT